MMLFELRILLQHHWALLGLSLLMSLALAYSPAFGASVPELKRSDTVSAASILLADDPPADEPSCGDSDGDGECDPPTNSPKD